MCIAGCWQIRALLHGAKSAATPACLKSTWGACLVDWLVKLNWMFFRLAVPTNTGVSLFKPQFMTPPSQQRIEGKWVSVCQLWAMMTQEVARIFNSELPERGLKQVETQNLSAFKGASITSYHIETRRFWICLNNSQYLAKQQDQVWMVQAPHFPSPKEENHLKCKVSFCIFNDHNSGDGTIPEVSRQRLERKMAQIQVSIAWFPVLLRKFLSFLRDFSGVHDMKQCENQVTCMRT